jgi:hypothetical protein
MQALYQLSYSPSIARVTCTRTAVSIPVPQAPPNILDTDRRPGPKITDGNPSPVPALRHGRPTLLQPKPRHDRPSPSSPSPPRPRPKPRPPKAQRSPVVAEHRLRQRPGIVFD